ncbi:MAG: mucoidy inhibitor MuiA family protein [Prevotella sp.]|nr:mucoidy inhibitor MuiA family protein [Prevotella sp.]
MTTRRIKMMLACLLTAVLAMAAEKHTASIERVTVFANGAQVVRSKSVQLVAGEQVVTFTGMSPYMDRKSMQLKARGRLTVLGVTHRTVHPDSLEQMKRLHQAEDAVKAVKRKIQQAEDEKEVLASQLELVKTNCSVASRTVATPLVNIKELNNYYSQEQLSIKKRTQDIDDDLVKLYEELTKKQEVLDSIGRIKMATATEVDVKVDAQQAGRADFDITYYVKNAGWFPSYDIRSEGTDKPLVLSYKANIYQNTKEEWKNVPVLLSSANPNRSNVAPQLKTYWLDYGLSAPTYDADTESNTVNGKVVDDSDGTPVIGATISVKGTHLGTVTDADGNFSITLPQGSRQLIISFIGYQSQTRTASPGTSLNVRLKEDQAVLNEVVVTGYGAKRKKGPGSARAAVPTMAIGEADMMVKESRPRMEESDVVVVEQQQAQFGYEFEIKQPLTLPDGGKTTTTEIARYQLPATYEYRGIPKIDKEAFLVADATDWQKLNLMEGEANVYFDNSFVGKSILDPNAASDTLHFSLGRDQSIRVQRTKVNESSTRRFLGSNQEQTLTWRITVKNTRREAVSITVFDQTPVSRNTGIEVTVEELSGGVRDKDTGIVTWPLQLQAGEQRELVLQYKVKYPKSRRLNIE